MKGPIADDAAFTPIQIEDRCKAEINAIATQFAPQNEASIGCRGQCPGRILIPNRPKLPHRGKMNVPVAETLHSPSFMIHRNQQRG